MALLRIRCASCGTKLEIPDDVIGQFIQCASCGSVFQAERPSDAERTSIVFGKKVMVVICILILLSIGGIGWPIYSEFENRRDVSEKHIKEAVSELPLEITDISVDWSAKPPVSDVIKSFWDNNSLDPITHFVSGRFTALTKTTEKFYESVANEDGLRELGVIELYTKKFDRAIKKIPSLPDSYQDDLFNIIPQNPSEFQFYKILVPEDADITLTGSIKMTRDGAEAWRKDDVQVDPLSFGDDGIPESRLGDVHKLDDPKTEEAVWAIIQKRKAFINQVDKAYEHWKFDMAQEKGFDRVADDQVLTITAKSVEWMVKTADSASGKFIVKTKTKEDLCRSVDWKIGLEQLDVVTPHREKIEQLGITEIFEKEIHEGGILKQFEFYRVLHPYGSEGTLSGSIKLIRLDNEDWEVEDIRIDSSSYGKDSTPASRLRHACRIDDPRTKETIESRLRSLVVFLEKLIKQKNGFEKHCKPGTQYNGRFHAFGGHCDVSVDFTEYDGPNKIKGTVAFLPVEPKGHATRSFSVNFPETTRPDQPITGSINNVSLPGFIEYRDRFGPLTKPQEEAVRNVWNVLNQCTIINIRFTDKMEFTLMRHEGDLVTDTMIADRRRPVPNVPESIVFNLRKNVEPKPVESLLDRNWVASAIKQWVADHPMTRPAAPSAPMND